MSSESATRKTNAYGIFRFRYAVLITLVLFIILDIGIRVYFSKPGIILRNEGNVSYAMDYLFEQMGKDDSYRKIAWLGASVMQGVHNTPPDQAYPQLVCKRIQKRGRDVACYNLAVSGANLGDMYLLMHESLNRGADIIVAAINYKIFSDQSKMGVLVRYPELLYHIRKNPRFVNIRQEIAGVDSGEWTNIFMDRTLADIWAFYRYKGLIGILMTGQGKPVFEHLKYTYAVNSGLARDNALEAAKSDYIDRNRDDLWKGMPDQFATFCRLTYSRINLSPDNPKWEVLEQMSKEAKERNATLIFLISPVNLEGAEQFKQFEKKDIADFRKILQRKINNNGNLVIDMSDKIDYRHFTDFEHMNLNGHKQLANKLSKFILWSFGRVKPKDVWGNAQ